jgi:ribonuclease BN (tRNA processing enzyme)
MKLTLCGTAAGPFTALRASSGYVLQSDGHSVMLDCGPGSVRNALVAGIELREVEAIFISHLHEDHCLDLATFAMQAMYGRFERLPVVYGPPGVRDVATRLMTMHRTTAQLPLLEVVEIDTSDEREVCGFVVCSEETPHAPDLHAFSRRFIAKGRSLVFSGDTASNPELMAVLARDTDLLLHECHSRAGLERYAALGSPERRERMLARLPMVHSNVSEVARIAQDAGVKRLVLTHILPTEIEADMAKEASAIYTGALTVARDGLVLEI